MTYKIIYPDSYIKRAKKFLKKRPEMHNQYQQALTLLEINPYHPSLRLHSLQDNLAGLCSVSINRVHRIVLQTIIQDNKIILIDVGHHDQVY